jgi:hypothetical protein
VLVARLFLARQGNQGSSVSVETTNTHTQTQPTSHAPQIPHVRMSVIQYNVYHQLTHLVESGNRVQAPRASTESPFQQPTASGNLPPCNPYLSPVVEERSVFESVTPQPSTSLPNPYDDSPQIVVEEATTSPPTGHESALSPPPLPHLYHLRAYSCRWLRWLSPCCQAPRNLHLDPHRNLCQSGCKRYLSCLHYCTLLRKVKCRRGQ